MNQAIAVAITGASGVQYGLRLLECLLQGGRDVQLMLSKPARLVIATETDLDLPGRPAEMRAFFAARFAVDPARLDVYAPQDFMAPPASGSNAPQAMVICPCTTATLSAVATGASRSLIERAADVVLKERRTLVMVVRETPLSVIHLDNMLQLAQAGAVMLPANPGFYHRPQSVADLIDFVVARILDHLQVPQELVPRWGGHE